MWLWRLHNGFEMERLKVGGFCCLPSWEGSGLKYFYHSPISRSIYSLPSWEVSRSKDCIALVLFWPLSVYGDWKAARAFRRQGKGMGNVENRISYFVMTVFAALVMTFAWVWLCFALIWVEVRWSWVSNSPTPQQQNTALILRKSLNNSQSIKYQIWNIINGMLRSIKGSAMLCKQRIVYSQTKHIYVEQTIRFVKHISKTITITKKRHSKIKKEPSPSHKCTQKAPVRQRPKRPGGRLF